MVSVAMHPRRVEAERRAVDRLNDALAPKRIVGHEGVYLLIGDGMAFDEGDVTAEVLVLAAAEYDALRAEMKGSTDE